ncbi:hypothetical protein N7495_009620 [Penicillium taxi]|uniref:uncharacterized protein n=1 Tax=Penicillium taxi TaxID=168475 RepID=UPI0025455D34|nr:uncharacterized protein N7495_009620 [Penicillium taxi]KAJ5885110.1 hypothetical protein N7495_009620 [Penicillium taxi]
MIMAIGFTTLQRAGEAQDIDKEESFDPCLKMILHECLCRIDEQSAGTLLLLGLYLLFKPDDIDPRAVAGVLTRHALAIGLVNEHSNSQTLTARALELRRRLSWSIYAFDRMISISYGIPFSFSDDRMQVPLPSIMIHEYASEEGHQYTIALQVSRHIIALRQLETRIINAIYDFGGSVRHKGLRREIEDWYTQGCLLSSSAMWDQDQLPFHTTITWLNVRYQNLLLLLYSPTQGGLPVESHLSTLQGAAQQYIQLSLILHEHRHLPMNWINLCRLLSLTATFFYCVTSWSTPPLQEIPEIGFLASLLDCFPSAWKAAHEGSQIAQRLADIVVKQTASAIPLSQSPESVIGGSLDTEGLQSIQDDLEALLSRTLGEASFYVWPLRSKVAERCASHQIAAMNSINAALDGGLLEARVGFPDNGTLAPAPEEGVQTVTPLEAAQWVNILGGLGSDML